MRPLPSPFRPPSPRRQIVVIRIGVEPDLTCYCTNRSCAPSPADQAWRLENRAPRAATAPIAQFVAGGDPLEIGGDAHGADDFPVAGLPPLGWRPRNGPDRAFLDHALQASISFRGRRHTRWPSATGPRRIRASTE